MRVDDQPSPSLSHIPTDIVSVLIFAELASGAEGAEIFNQIPTLVWILMPEPSIDSLAVALFHTSCYDGI